MFNSQLSCSEVTKRRGGYSESYLAQICMKKEKEINILYSFPFLAVLCSSNYGG